ncbi:hypothetical protein ACWC5C_37900 [Streptomyces sp. NPDC001700]
MALVASQLKPLSGTVRWKDHSSASRKDLKVREQVAYAG